MDLFWFVSNLYPDRFQKGCQATQINLRNLRWQEQGPTLPHLPRRSAHLTPSKQARDNQGANTGGRWHPAQHHRVSTPSQARPFPSCPACLFPVATHVHAGLYYPWAIVGGKQPCHTHPRNKNNVTRWNQINSSFGGRVCACLIIKSCLTVSKEGGGYLGSWQVTQSPHSTSQQLHFPGGVWQRGVGAGAHVHA